MNDQYVSALLPIDDSARRYDQHGGRPPVFGNQDWYAIDFELRDDFGRVALDFGDGFDGL